MTWEDIFKREIGWYSDGNTFIEGLTIGEALKLLRKKSQDNEHDVTLSKPYDDAISMLLEVIKVLEG
tara:strand:+ start:52 stop:252 length:201 start_codon:yes stop_codon:yes gene_type:complete